MSAYDSRSSFGRPFALLRAVALVATVAVAASPVARAQLAVHCVNCSTMWTQLMEYAKQAQQLETQLQQYQTQLQQYANMVTNTVGLPQELWGNVQSDIMQVRSLSNAASLLSGNAGSIVTRLQSASMQTRPPASATSPTSSAPGSRRSATTWALSVERLDFSKTKRRTTPAC